MFDSHVVVVCERDNSKHKCVEVEGHGQPLVLVFCPVPVSLNVLLHPVSFGPSPESVWVTPAVVMRAVTHQLAVSSGILTVRHGRGVGVEGMRLV